MGVEAKCAHLPPLPSDIGERLEGLAEISDDVLFGWLTFLSLLGVVKRGLLSGLTILYHVVDYALANLFQCTLETYEGLLAILCSVGVISQSLMDEYPEVDSKEVACALRRAPQVFRSFGAEVLSWLSQWQKEG